MRSSRLRKFVFVALVPSFSSIYVTATGNYSIICNYALIYEESKKEMGAWERKLTETFDFITLIA